MQYSRRSRLLFSLTAFALAFFLLAMTLHAILPHQHEHDGSPIGAMVLFHGGLSERLSVFLLLFGFLLAIRQGGLVQSGTARGHIRGDSQSHDALALFALRPAFSAGVVHPGSR